MNGFLKRDGEKFLWIGKRSPMKQTFPGMLDHLVAGGLVCNYLLYHSMKLVSGLHCQIKTKGRFHYLFIYF